jgi:peptidoglycan/xylan/chitin deacetylase (PgdA/CDA1 family)/CelD/BcsL family acetyltransferase involved in cellulose biosynthesis
MSAASTLSLWTERLTIAYHAILDEWVHPLALRPEDMGRQLATLARAGYQSVTLTELTQRPDATGVVAITFDDGFRSVYETALPLLESLGWKATVFVTTNALTTGEPMTWLTPSPGEAPRGALQAITWDQAADLAAHGWEIGSHTETHARLSLLSAEERQRELEQSRLEIITHVGSCTSISYPWGEQSLTLATAARAAGYTAGSGLEGRFIDGDAMRVPRVAISRYDTKARFRLKCSRRFWRARATRAWDAIDAWRAPTRHDDVGLGTLYELPQPLRSRVLGAEALEGAEAERWRALRERVGATPYAGPDFIRWWLKDLGRGWHPFIVFVEDVDTGELCAVAPLVKRRLIAVNAPGRLAVAGELVADDAVAPEAWRVIGGQIAQSRSPAFALFPHLPQGPRGRSGAEAGLAKAGAPWRAWPRFARYTLELSGRTFDAYYTSLSKKGRYGYRSTKKLLEERGSLAIRRVGGEEAYEALRPLHIRQWTPEKTIHWVHTDAGAELDRRLLRRHESGGLVIEVDGTTVAAAVYFDVSSRRIVPYVARDIDFQGGSPGEFLWMELIRVSFEDGIQLLDTLGEGTIKDHLRLERNVEYELVIGARSSIGRGAVQLRRLQLVARSLRGRD